MSSKKSPADIGGKFDQAWNWVSRASWSKVALGVLAILVGLWQYSHFDDRIANEHKTLADHGHRLDNIERALTVRFNRLDNRADNLDKRASDLERQSEDFNAAIARAVERGITRGVQLVLQRIRGP